MQFLRKIKTENVRKRMKLVKTKARKNYLLSEPNHHTSFHQKIYQPQKLKERQIFMNKPFYIVLTILEIGKTVMYEFCYEKAKTCFMGTNTFIVYWKAEMIYLDIAKDFETSFDISNYELERLLSWRKNKKDIGLMENDWGEKIKYWDEKHIAI